MKLAVNYSTPLRKLIQADEVRVDLLKCPEWDGIVAPALALGSVYIHFEIALGRDIIHQLNFGLIRRMLRLTGTKYLNVHLSNLSHAVREGKNAKKNLLRRWESDLAVLRREFPNKPIIAENLPWLTFLPELEIAADPELISAFLTRNNLGLLLDLSHAQISAEMFGISCEKYIARLPLKRLIELHVTGIRQYGGYATDHFEIQPEDWKVLEWAASQIACGAWKEPEIVAFEYGGVGDVFCWRTQESALLDQVPRLYQLFGEKTEASA